MLLDGFKQAQRRVVARSGSYGGVQTRYRLEIVVINIRPRCDDRFDRGVCLVPEIRGQNFNRRIGRVAAQRLDDFYKLAGTAIG